MSLQQAALRMADRAAGALGVLGGLLDADELAAVARRRAGLDDFGVPGLRDAMQRFLSACAAEADLSLIGQFATRWDSLRFLSNLLRLRAEEARAPDILGQPIVAPIFITGLPRSGTSFLHRLMLADPGARAPRVWQTIHPYPLGHGRDNRRERVGRQLRTFGRLAPEFRDRHPLDAHSPQECTEITAHVFRSLRFDTTHSVPSYRSWLDAEGHIEAYRFHRRFLRHLQHQEESGHWVLKSPDHVFALDAIHAVYPDARVIFLHRHPLHVVASNARLTEILREPFTRGTNRFEIGRQESARWQLGTSRMIAEDRAARFAAPILHLMYGDLVADPGATIERIYRHFGLPPSASVVAAAAASRAGRYPARVFALEEFGLDPAREAQAFGAYIEHFRIAA
jgi:hypothetical protein